MAKDCYTSIKWHNNIITIYIDIDGEPITHGVKLASYLKDYRILRDDAFLTHYPKKAYGIYMLTGKIIRFFRETYEEFVIHKESEFDVDYEYEVRRFKGKPHIIIIKGERMIFSGRPDQFLNLSKEEIIELDNDPIIYENKYSRTPRSFVNTKEEKSF